ncbi:hypothetical protein [Tenacibaculum agarivorans]|uniref:hypothetical protein n=1 Tax=Tenacibaculum agarivorans TaxID=1908389 RepID=UPI00094BC001|nr:hypothetical protein [Tenacibaculum agarivorans]
MKKYYTLVLLWCIGTTISNAQEFTPIQDDSFEQALVDLNIDDTPGDGQVRTSAIAGLTSLDISSKGVSNMSGIEAFVSLTELYASDNAFSDINLNTLTNLQVLNLNNCPITNLNLNGNSSLRHLDVEGGGNLTSIDFSNNSFLEHINLNNNLLSNITWINLSSLRELHLNNNNLTALDLSTLTSLNSFSARENNLNFLRVNNGNNTTLMSFEIMNNPNLSCISVDDADFSTANWTSIDTQMYFSNYNCRYTAIPDANFEAVLNALDYDDIENDKQVPTALIENLTSLNLENKGISDLTGIEDFVALITLIVDNNNLSTVDLSSNTSLITLRLKNNKLPTVDLSKNTELRVLVLEDNGLTSLDISKNVNIGRLFLGGNNLTSMDLRNNPQIVVVGINYNNLSYLNVKSGNNTRIQTFVISNNPNLTCVAVDDVDYSTTNWTSIDSQTTFSNRDCIYTSIPDPNFEAALSMYDNMPNDGRVPRAAIETIPDLNIENLGIKDLTGIEDFIALKTLFAANNVLETIDLSKNTNLETLSLGNNDITSIDLSANTELTDLSIENNNLIALDLSKNVKLIDIVVSENDLENLKVTNCVSLDRIDARDNKLKSINLSTNTVLNELRLENNLLKEINLSTNTNLYEVYLDNNDLEFLTLTTMTRLNGLFVSNNNLRLLDLRNGSNTYTEDFDATGNTDLGCILVDDVAYSTANWTQIDSQTNFSEDYCRYTAIPDPYFEAALSSYDNTPNDRQVPTALIEMVNTLNVSNANITDITGIKDFKGLQSLDISNNSIEVVDISSMNNLALLEASGAITTSLDASNTASLTSINVSESTISTINLTDASALKELFVYKTNISDLDLSTNNALVRLIAFEITELETIDLTDLVALKELELDKTSIQSLDLSTNIVLEHISVSQTNLNFFNLKNGNNTSITSFYAPNNPNLPCILVDNETYSTANWTNIDSLVRFSETYCRYTSVPNLAFEMLLESLGYDDKPRDGEVPTALIEKVSFLDLADLGITDIIGIEDFVGLTDLNLEGNNMETIDLSNNTFLESFNCNSCTSLQSINISGLDVLRELKLKNTKITEIDLGSVSLLETLNLRESEIAAIDVSHNSNLKTLNISSTDIEFLDLSTNNGLTKLTAFEANLNYLNLKNTNIINVDVRGNPGLSCILIDDESAIPDGWDYDNTVTFSNTYCRYTSILDDNFEAALYALDLDNTLGDEQVPTKLIEGLVSLNVSNKGIENFSGIEDFIALETLEAEDNVLESIDISNNTALKYLFLSRNELTTIDLTKNTELIEIYLEANAITDIDLSKNTELNILDLGANLLTNIDVSKNTLLFELELDENNLTTIDLSRNSELERFTIADNQLETLNLFANDGLEFLRCSENQLTALDVSGSSAIASVYASDNNLTEIKLPFRSNFLEVINLNGNEISDLDLSDYDKLQQVDVQYNLNLTRVNLQSGGNINLREFNSTGSINLTCIRVDDVVNTSWATVEAVTGFSDTYCRYTSVPDPYFEAALSRLDDSPGDKRIPTALIEEENTLILRNTDISDLTGLEDFRDLEVLALTDLDITEVDLSANTNLQGLTIDRNSFLTSIEISTLTKLEILSLHFASTISTLDVSKNTALERLTVSNTDLKQVVFGGNTTLQRLSLSQSSIENLDLSKLTGLVTVELSNNNLSSLNLRNGNNTKMSFVHLRNNPNLYCVQVDDVDYADTNFTNKDDQTSFDVNCESLEVDLKVILEGAFEVSGPMIMRDDLNDNNLLPTTSPYSDVINGDPTSTSSPGPGSIVDWVEVQLRNPNDINEILYRQSAFLQRSGSVVAVDDQSTLELSAWRGNYYIAVAHRNHLPIVTNTIHLLNGSGPFSTKIDFTEVSNILGGTNAVNDMGNGYYAMPVGDYDGNGQIQNADINAVIQQLGSSGYNNADLDMNGQVQNTDINNLLNPNVGKGEQF